MFEVQADHQSVLLGEYRTYFRTGCYCDNIVNKLLVFLTAGLGHAEGVVPVNEKLQALGLW
jgi:hypothetical protein